MEAQWKPRWNVAADLETLSLTADDTSVLTRLDGLTSVGDLPAITGLSPERIAAALDRLVSYGAVEAPVTAPAAPAAAPPIAPSAAQAHSSASPPSADDEEDASTEPDAADSAGTHRKLFEGELHALNVDERAARAATAAEPYLSAFCYDPVPSVIKALLTNPSTGLAHARLIAQHHRNPAGLEAIASRGAFAQDAGVRRWLVRNPQLPSSLFTRLFGGRGMLELFRLTLSRDVPEQTRRTSREALRRRFASGTADERVALIIRSEGRALAGLSGIPVDGRTTALLCGRTYASTTLIQNIARWSAAPPALIAYLLKQESVRRSPSLRTLLQRHPNAPSDRPQR